MTPQQLHDALNFLSDDLLEQTDSLRQKKRISWKPLAALAACVCLVVGLYLLTPSTADKNSAECIEDIGSIDYSESAAGTYLIGEILAVDTDKLEIKTPGKNAPVTVSLANLESIPNLEPGQKIHIYCRDTEFVADSSDTELTPYKIEIIDNKED